MNAQTKKYNIIIITINYGNKEINETFLNERHTYELIYLLTWTYIFFRNTCKKNWTGILRYKYTKSEGGITIFSVGPTICDTYQVCCVHIEYENIHRNENF